MTLDLREIARAQNDADHAAGLLPSRYVEDPVVLYRVAGLLLADPEQKRSGRKERASVGAPPATSAPLLQAPERDGVAAPVLAPAVLDGEDGAPLSHRLGTTSRAGRLECTALKGGGRRAAL